MAQKHRDKKEDIVILNAFRDEFLTLDRSGIFFVETIEDDCGEYYNVSYKLSDSLNKKILGSYLNKDCAKKAIKKLFNAIGKGKKFHKMYGRLV